MNDALRHRFEAEVAERSMTAPRLLQLAATFGMTEAERDIVGALWISTFDSAARTSLLAVEPWSAGLTARSIASHCGHVPRARLESESALTIWSMVEEQALMDGSAALTLDPHILAWLEGGQELDRNLIGHAITLRSTIESEAWPLDAWAALLEEGLRSGVRWRVHVSANAEPQAGGDNSADRVAELACIAALGRRLGMPVLGLHIRAVGTLGERVVANADAIRRLHRQAFLDHCAPCLISHDPAAFELGPECPPFPIEFVQGPARVGAALRADLRADQRHIQLRMPPLTADQKVALWREALPQSAAWPEDELRRLGAHNDASAADIMRTAATWPESAREAARTLTAAFRDELQGLAQRIDAVFTWDDLVLPGATIERLRDIEFEARERQAVWSDPAIARLYPHGRGLVALLAGPPGIGKTMAAQVIAAGVGMDLLRVDLSAVVSKWVGETSQHLQTILASRASRHAVLFFDEADALYGKRVEDTRDAQDRYSNMDISHLMVALENFDGVVLLATNLKGNIDGAFLRRIRHCVEFTRPDAGARRAIWERVLGTVFPQAKQIDAGQLAALESTGAQIKQAVLSVLFTARRQARAPTTLLLAQMLAREMAKDGGGLSQRELNAALGLNDIEGGS